MVGHSVVLAFVLAAMVFAVMVAAHGRISKQADDATYCAYRSLPYDFFMSRCLCFRFAKSQGAKDAYSRRPPVQADRYEEGRQPCHQSHWSPENVSLSHCR